jgi:hypothetical protein
MNRQTITDFYGKILGYVSTDSRTGDKTATNFYGKILGYYRKSSNVTTDFYGKIVAKGDAVTGLVYENKGN